MEYNEISYDEFIKRVKEHRSAFLCGNGFSINFDDTYKVGNLVERLYTTHCHLKTYESYEIVSNHAYKSAVTGNYKSAKKMLRKINDEVAFNKLFVDAVAFANSLTTNELVVSWIDDNGFNSKLTFGLAHIDLVQSIVDQAKEYGEMYVNYEYWSVLIYYILALKNAPTEIYSFDGNNSFVKATLLGASNSLVNEPITGHNIFLDTSINGMYTYLRFLFTTNILLNGKSYNVEQLNYWEKYDIKKISSFLSNFNELITTNYDLLLENITKREIFHLHGYYSKEKKRVLSQSLGAFYDLVRYDLSTTVIGDYFLSKSFLQTVSKLATKQPQNSSIEIYSDILNKVLVQDKCDVIVIFGLNLDNDYHILRDIQISLEAAKSKTPEIIYCYFNENDKSSFISGYDSCITYSKELNDFVRNNISISILDSKQIIERIFTA